MDDNHDLRHSNASLLLASGVNPKIASERLGNRSVGFALDAYSHVTPGMQSEAAERIADFVLGDDDDPHDPPPQDASDP